MQVAIKWEDVKGCSFVSIIGNVTIYCATFSTQVRDCHFCSYCLFLLFLCSSSSLLYCPFFLLLKVL